MVTKDPSLPNQGTSSVVSGIGELRRIKEDYVDRTLTWYRNNRIWPLLLFRISGIAVIVSSLSIPFLAAGNEGIPKYAVPVASLVVAVSAGLNAFFQWQSVWQKRVNIYLTLEGWIALWEARMARATQEDDYEAAVSATEELIENTRAIQVTETASLFSKIQFPETTRK